jgi:hypothetical protein
MAPLLPLSTRGKRSRPPSYQDALLDELALEERAALPQAVPYTPPTSAPSRPAGSPLNDIRTGASPFARGGRVTQGPGRGPGVTNLAVSTGANIAGRVAGGTAAGGAVSLGTDYLGGKLKPKEDVATYGGEFGRYTDSFGRRHEGAGPGRAGGAVRGAGYGANPALVAATGGMSVPIGAAVGAIAGAATKNAPSAYTDFRVEDAADAIQQMYREELGRPASDAEIMGHLRGQGWDGQSRWVGEKGLFAVLAAVRNSPEAKAKTGGGAAPAAGGQAPLTRLAPSPMQAMLDEMETPGEGTSAPPAAGDPTAPYAGPQLPGATQDAFGVWNGTGQVDPSAAVAAAQRSTPNNAVGLEGFDLGRAQDPSFSAKDSFAKAWQAAGSPPPGADKPALTAWFDQHIRAQMEADGHTINWVDGDKFNFTSPQGTFTVDWVRGAGAEGFAGAWQVEDGSGGNGATPPPAAAGAGGGGPLDALVGGDNEQLQAIMRALQTMAAGNNAPQTLRDALLGELERGQPRA